jgi:ABC-type tungstate transport system permease subunit
MSTPIRRPVAAAAAVVATALTVASCGGSGADRSQPRRQALIVQSTTSVRDSGLLTKLIQPQFERRYRSGG